jgi:hypothetical protein
MHGVASEGEYLIITRTQSHTPILFVGLDLCTFQWFDMSDDGKLGEMEE